MLLIELILQTCRTGHFSYVQFYSVCRLLTLCLPSQLPLVIESRYPQVAIQVSLLLRVSKDDRLFLRYQKKTEGNFHNRKVFSPVDFQARTARPVKTLSRWTDSFLTYISKHIFFNIMWFVLFTGSFVTCNFHLSETRCKSTLAHKAAK